MTLNDQPIIKKNFSYIWTANWQYKTCGFYSLTFKSMALYGSTDNAQVEVSYRFK